MTLLMSTLLVSTHTMAEPSKAISSMMDTSSSVFDVFLFRLLEESKCYRGWFDNREKNDKPDLCMTSIRYKFDDNLIEMNFFVWERHKGMKGFATGNDQQKEKILKNILSGVARSVGVEPIDGRLSNFRFGIIQTTPIRHGWSTKGFDEELAREEVANRTVIHLRTNVAGFVYTVTRDHHGKVTFEKPKH